MPDYIPKLATIEQSCEWLRARLGGVWILPRLLECHLKPYFWINFEPGYPQIFGGKVEGYLAWMIFAGDVHRLEADGTNALVNMFPAHDGTLVKIEPGWTVPLSELKFKREDLERVASILEGKAGQQAAATFGTPKNAAPPVSVVTPAVRGVTKQQVMNAFEGMAFDREHWSKNLASPQKWLKDCRVALGNKNISALWNPALIAAALHDKNVSLKRLDAVFVGLKDWADEWGEVSAIFRD